MTAEIKMAAKTFVFQFKITKITIIKNKNNLLQFLSKNTTLIQKKIFYSKWWINQNGECFYKFFEML
jgi:hypothetical protein